MHTYSCIHGRKRRWKSSYSNLFLEIYNDEEGSWVRFSTYPSIKETNGQGSTSYLAKHACTWRGGPLVFAKLAGKSDASKNCSWYLMLSITGWRWSSVHTHTHTHTRLYLKCWQKKKEFVFFSQVSTPYFSYYRKKKFLLVSVKSGLRRVASWHLCPHSSCCSSLLVNYWWDSDGNSQARGGGKGCLVHGLLNGSAVSISM
jgi:hypothetical protein